MYLVVQKLNLILVVFNFRVTCTLSLREFMNLLKYLKSSEKRITCFLYKLNTFIDFSITLTRLVLIMGEALSIKEWVFR